jgi:serine/threonine-protein kinase
MERVILKSLAKNPAERFQDMDEFIAAVERAASPSDYYEEPIVRKPATVETTMVMGSGGRPVVQKVETVSDDSDEDEEEDDDEDETSGKKSAMPVYILILVAFLFVITYSLYKRGDLSLMLTKDTVPDLVAISLEDARKKVDARGWQIQIEEEVFHAKVPEGIIISQRPAMGEKLPRGGVIYVIISKGSTKAEVPDITGLSMEEAKALLTARKLGWVVKDSVYSDTVKRDYIVSQDPAAGEEVAPGKKISIILSLGSEKTEVPDITGMTKDKAIAELRRRGLQLVVEEQKKDSGAPEGQILSQKPAAGQRVDPGTKVSVVISVGSEIAIAPDLVGKTLGEAMAMLDTLKIRIDVTDGTNNQNAKVVGQDPSAGKELDSKVVKVWCTEDIKVPGVVGKKMEDAQNSISAAGLQVKIDYVESGEAAGTVISQEPGAGTSADRDSIIVITVAKKQTAAPVEPTPALSPQPAATPSAAPEPPPAPGTTKKENDSGVKIIR